MILKMLLNTLSARSRTSLAEEGRALRTEIESLGIPRIWGSIPPETLAKVRSWQQRCSDAGLSVPAVFRRFDSNDETHISAADVMLVVSEIMMGLDPAGMIGG